MMYAKYSRGYRMGSLNSFGGELFRKYEPERVNTYELGAKTRFHAPISGTFNIAVFYNDLSDQQLQYA
jgi:iron complex outermembrane receptor protein